MMLFSCSPCVAVAFAAYFQHSVSNMIQLGFSLLSALLGGEDGSLLTEKSEISSFEVSMASSVLSTFNTCILYFMFLKWKDFILIITDAKYSCAIFFLQLCDFVLSVVAITLSFKILVESRSDWWLYIFPSLKILLTLNTIYDLFKHRPSREGGDMLYFAACDSKVCAGETGPQASA
jgi:hypothetical protein